MLVDNLPLFQGDPHMDLPEAIWVKYEHPYRTVTRQQHIGRYTAIQYVTKKCLNAFLLNPHSIIKKVKICQFTLVLMLLI
jgi:hypothetical protein